MVAAVPVDGGLGRHLIVGWPLGGIVTRPGIVVGEDDSVVLRSWDRLAPLWRISVDSRIPDDVIVATSTSGVAVGIRSPHPSTVTWLS